MRDREILDGVEAIIDTKRNLEASILAFRIFLKNASKLETREAEEAIYWLSIYDKHFNITELRNGTTEN